MVLSKPYWGLGWVSKAVRVSQWILQGPAYVIGLTQGLYFHMYLRFPLAWEKAKLVLAQGVSAVQKLNGSQPWSFFFPHPFAPNLSTKTVLLLVFSLLACHCYTHTEKRSVFLLPCLTAPESSPVPFQAIAWLRKAQRKAVGSSVPQCAWSLLPSLALLVGAEGIAQLLSCTCCLDAVPHQCTQDNSLPSGLE